MSHVFIILQYLVPQHLLSRLAGHLADTQIAWVKSLLIHQFIKAFKVNMDEAENSDPDSYASFNEFFCRPLKPDARPIDSEQEGIACPADGAVSQLGKIDSGRIFQAKGRDYSVAELLGTAKHETTFQQGKFATIYLSPKDYHRLHMPLDGTLISMTHVPGDLFSVNPTTTDNVPRLFARNERVVCLFDTALGPVALVLVGAMIVASIETTWSGLVTPPGKKIVTTDYQKTRDIVFKKGDEFARFKLGSTIIMLFPEDSMTWEENLAPESVVKMGELIAKT